MKYFCIDIPEIRIRVIKHPNIPLKNVFTFRLKMIQPPIEGKKRKEQGVIKRYLRRIPRW